MDKMEEFVRETELAAVEKLRSYIHLSPSPDVSGLAHSLLPNTFAVSIAYLAEEIRKINRRLDG
jgi:hypothetical protein